jgi:electron transfer flavoprotein beta subunit
MREPAKFSVWLSLEIYLVKEGTGVKIVVCVKQVPDTKGGVKFKPDGTLDRAAMKSIMNPDDKAGLEAALRIKDEIGAEVTVITMGLPKAEDVLREALAMGADKGVLVTDRVLAGADTWATSQTIAAAIRNLEYDLIITGRQAIDGDTAQVGPQISEHLNIPVISYAEEIKVDGDSVIVKRQFDDRYHMLKAKMPCLITALSELNKPRYMTPGGILDAFNAEITVWSRDDLKTLDDSNMGLKGSPTQIAKASDKVAKGAGEKFVPDSANDAAQFIISKLAEKHVI